MNSRQRVWFLDEARGLSILLMVLHHGAYDAAFLARVAAGFSFGRVVRDHPHFFRRRFCADFRLRLPVFPQQSAPGRTVPFTGGRAVRHHRFSDPRPADPFRHFAPAGLRHAAFCLFTTAAGPDSPAFGAGVGLFLFFFCFSVPSGRLGFGPMQIQLPRCLFQNAFTAALGFPGPGYYSADYFPLIPWLFLFWAGVCVGVWLRLGRGPGWLYQRHSRFLRGQVKNPFGSILSISRRFI